MPYSPEALKRSRAALTKEYICTDSNEAFRLARLIALIVRAHPDKAKHADRMVQVELTDAGEQGFGLHIKWSFISFTDHPGKYYRKPDLIIATTCLAWAELCVGAITVEEAVEAGVFTLKRGTTADAREVFDLLYKLRVDTPIRW